MKHSITERRDRVLSILLCIRDIPGSNLGPETEYSEVFSWFSSVPPGKCRDSTLKLGHNLFPPNPLHFIIRLSPLRSSLYSLSY
jgi:hypothetical protein